MRDLDHATVGRVEEVAGGEVVGAALGREGSGIHLPPVGVVSDSCVLGVPSLRLDARHDVIEARELYASLGFVEVAPFNDGPYAEHWFEQVLSLEEGCWIVALRNLRPHCWCWSARHFVWQV